MPTIVQNTNLNALWTGHISVAADPAVTKYRLYCSSSDTPSSYRFVDQKTNAGTAVVAEAVGTGDGVATVFNLVHANVYTATAVIKVDGVTKTPGADYTLTLAGVLTFTAPPANLKPITADYSYGADLTFGPYSYGALHLVTPTRAFFLRCTEVKNGQESDIGMSTALAVAVSAIPGWTLGQLLEQDMRPVILVGLDPTTGMFYPLNVITDGGTGFKLKT